MFKKTLMYFTLMNLLTLLFSCSSGGGISEGYTVGGGSTMSFPGLIAFKTTQSEYDIDTPTDFRIDYGHFFNLTSTLDYSHIDYFAIEVIVEDITDGDFNGIGVTEYRLEIDDFITEEYKVEMSSPTILLSDITFNAFTEIEIDFTKYDFDRGVIYFYIFQYSHNAENEPVINKEGRTIYFEKIGEKVIITFNNPNNK
ncbi:hypothetical protein RJI07_01640 [Mycoplasmatota bacterium WC30]